jgi:hypothetical protein
MLAAAGGPAAGEHLHHHPTPALRAVARRLELAAGRARRVVMSRLPALVTEGRVHGS